MKKFNKKDIKKMAYASSNLEQKEKIKKLSGSLNKEDAEELQNIINKSKTINLEVELLEKVKTIMEKQSRCAGDPKMRYYFQGKADILLDILVMAQGSGGLWDIVMEDEQQKTPHTHKYKGQ